MRTNVLTSVRFCAIAVWLSAMMLPALHPEPLFAGTIIKVNFGDSGPDVGFDGSHFGTADDLDGATPGLQNSQVIFSGPFASLYPDVTSGASLSISGIGIDGAAGMAGVMIIQSTLGGSFSLYDDLNELLLSGSLSNGLMVGMSGSPAASFFSTGPVEYTGGWLLPQLKPTSGALSLSLGGVSSGSHVGLQITGGQLAPFTADATGSLGGIHGTPEPASVVVFAGMAIGLGVWGHRRRARFRREGKVTRGES